MLSAARATARSAGAGGARARAPRALAACHGRRAMDVIYVLNGPNLNLLGKRQPHIYGQETLADVEANCRRLAAVLGLELRFRQSNHEHELIDWIHEARASARGIIINPAALTHTSLAIAD